MRSYKDLNVKDSNGCTPLDLSSYSGHTDCVKLLLTSDYPSDVLVYSHSSRRTALHAAGNCYWSKLIQLFQWMC